MPAKTRVALLLLVLACAPASAQMRVVGEIAFGDVADRVVAADPVARKGFVVAWNATTVFDLDTLAARLLVIEQPTPQSLLVDANAGRLYISDGGGGSSRSGGRITVLDTRTERVVAALSWPVNTWRMAADFARGELYAGAVGGRLGIVDTRTLAVAGTVQLDYALGDIAADRVRGRLIAGRALDGDGAIAVIDRATRSIVARPGVDDGGAPWNCDDWFVPCYFGPGFAWADERSGSFYLQHDRGWITALRPDAGAWTARKLFEGGVAGLSTERTATSNAWGRAYQIGPLHYSITTAARFDRVVGIELATGLSEAKSLQVPGGDAPYASVLADDDGGDVYVATGAPVALHRLDPATLAVRESLALPIARAHSAFRDPVTGRLFVAGPDRLIIVESSGAKAGTHVATSFRHTAFDHHFVTADPIEQRLVDDGRFGADWRVAPDLFRVWSQPVAGSVPVCRFFSARFAPKSSHFYTPLSAECESLKAGGDWQYEGVAFHVALPDAAGGCTPGTEPLYRLYNGGRGGAPNHRYTVSRDARDAAEREGWIVEGAGADRVFACTPALR